MEAGKFPSENEQIKPLEGCWCKGAKNIMEVEGMQHLLAQFNSSFEEIKFLMADLKSSFMEEFQKASNQTLARKSFLSPNASSLPCQTGPSTPKTLKLQFKGVPDSLLAKTKLEEECEDACVVVELIDDTGKRVVEGPESCLTIKIDVIDCSEVKDNFDWTQEEYTKRITRPRGGKVGSLLMGKCKLELNKGAVSIGHLSFTGNSSSMSNRSVKLGAISEDFPLVKIGVSEAVRVKDSRLKYSKKCEKPSAEDDLWRLVGVSKNGPIYARALKEGIRTVKDFLIRYHSNARDLQQILDVPEANWKKIVKNAKACKLPDLVDDSHKNNNVGFTNNVQSSNEQPPRQPPPPQPLPEQTQPAQLTAMPPLPSPLNWDIDVDGFLSTSNPDNLIFNQMCTTPAIFHTTTAMGMDNDRGLEYENLNLQVADYGIDHTTFNSILNIDGIDFGQESSWHNSPIISAEGIATVTTKNSRRLYLLVKRVILAKRVISLSRRTPEIDCRPRKMQKI